MADNHRHGSWHLDWVEIMARPKAYSPEQGYKYQILCRADRGAYEHCDYAKTRQELAFLLGEYHLAYGAGWEFSVETFPIKYWPRWEVYDTLNGKVLKTCLYVNDAEHRAGKERLERGLLREAIIVREQEASV